MSPMLMAMTDLFFGFGAGLALGLVMMSRKRRRRQRRSSGVSLDYTRLD